jgi:hypothetical protein
MRIWALLWRETKPRETFFPGLAADCLLNAKFYRARSLKKIQTAAVANHG